MWIQWKSDAAGHGFPIIVTLKKQSRLHSQYKNTAGKHPIFTIPEPEKIEKYRPPQEFTLYCDLWIQPGVASYDL